MHAKQSQKLIDGISILVADQNQHARKLTRTMLTNIGAKSVYEAADGIATLDFIRSANPDVVFLDWEMPFVSGAELLRIIRSPGVFPNPDVPIIMLTAKAYLGRVNEAIRLGVHEFLRKPTSSAELRDRILSILTKPRPMMRVGEFYVPKHRRRELQCEFDACSIIGSAPKP
jgi:two-component system, chemotaxis family, chemotaxis protein CheY